MFENFLRVYYDYIHPYCPLLAPPAPSKLLSPPIYMTFLSTEFS